MRDAAAHPSTTHAKISVLRSEPALNAVKGCSAEHAQDAPLRADNYGKAIMRLPFDHFDLIARFYDRLIRARESDPLVGLLAAEPGQRVLDVGGGTGRIATSLLAAGARVVVCDTSLPMARQARAKGLPAVVSDVTRLPFATGCTERVLVVDAFHHFVAPTPQIAQPAAARELLRTLAPGGRLVIEEPDVSQPWVWPIVVMEKLLLMGSRFLNPEALARQFETAGAQVRTRRRSGLGVQLVLVKQNIIALDSRL